MLGGGLRPACNAQNLQRSFVGCFQPAEYTRRPWATTTITRFPWERRQDLMMVVKKLCVGVAEISGRMGKRYDINPSYCDFSLGRP